MRTTVTLDPDVRRMIEEEMRKKGQGFKKTLNQLLRESLAFKQNRGKTDFVVIAKDMGVRPGIDTGRYSQLIDEMDIDDYLGDTDGNR